MVALLLAMTASAYTISDYPYFFAKNSTVDALYVVGEEAPALDVVSATLISSSLARYNMTTKVGTSKIDSEVPDVTIKNAVIIGSPCENAAAAQLLGNPNPCYANLSGNTGYIKLFERFGKVQILITGLSEKDRHAAAKYLAEQNLKGIKTTEFMFVSNSGSTPPFYSSKQSTNESVASTSETTREPPAPQNVTFANETPKTVHTQVKPAEERMGEYEPLDDVPKPKQGFFEWLWSWFAGLFS